MRICVVGTGYVGLVAGAGFAEFGNDVICADVNADKIERLNRGEIPIYEPGLAPLVERNVAEKRLSFTTDVEKAVSDVEVVFVAVGTPPAADGSADLSHVWSVARTVGEHASGFTVVVNKSTVPVGTADRVREILTKSGGDGKEFAVVSNPEFLKEGDAVSDFMKPSRVIIGTDNAKAKKLMRYLYAPFVRTRERIQVMDNRSAEVTKYACNAMLATRISFMNEMARLCEAVGADVQHVRLGMAWDERIGSRFLFPGVGYGGSCFPKDVKAIISTAREHEMKLSILEAVEDVNESQKQHMAKQVLAHFEGKAEGLTVALWGLSFKPHTDDVREAPAMTIARQLLDHGATLRLHDPVARETFKVELPASDRVIYCDHNYDAVENADALVLVTEWPAYRRPDWQRIKASMRGTALFDGRNIWTPDLLREMGFSYVGIGRSRG
jgi:UDPglucose 6-dehydrogenase